MNKSDERSSQWTQEEIAEMQMLYSLDPQPFEFNMLPAMSRYEKVYRLETMEWDVVLEHSDRVLVDRIKTGFNTEEEAQTYIDSLESIPDN